MASKGFRLLSDGDPATGMQPSDLTPPESFSSENHTETNHTFFATADEPILSGSVTLKNADG